jgi:hypothetical protein
MRLQAGIARRICAECVTVAGVLGLFLLISPSTARAQEGCRIAKRPDGASTSPAMAALAAVNFGMEGRVRAVLVDTAVRESRRFVPGSPERLPIIAVLPKAEVAALSVDSLPFGVGAFTTDWTESDTARVVLIRLVADAAASAKDTVWIPRRADRAAVVVYVYGRPFPANFLAYVKVQRTGRRWFAAGMACFEE